MDTILIEPQHETEIVSTAEAATMAFVMNKVMPIMHWILEHRKGPLLINRSSKGALDYVKESANALSVSIWAFFPGNQEHKVGISTNYFFPYTSFVKCIIFDHKLQNVTSSSN